MFSPPLIGASLKSLASDAQKHEAKVKGKVSDFKRNKSQRFLSLLPLIELTVPFFSWLWKLLLLRQRTKLQQNRAQKTSSASPCHAFLISKKEIYNPQTLSAGKPDRILGRFLGQCALFQMLHFYACSGSGFRSPAKMQKVLLSL